MDFPTTLAPASTRRSTPAGEAILEAASSLFYARGITATGVDLIADTAGTTKRTIYQRYGSKDALVAAYLRRRLHDWQTHLLDELDTAPPLTPPLAIALVFRESEHWTRDVDRGCSFVNAWAELGATTGESRELVRAEKAWMRALFTHLAGDPEAGRLIHLLYEGAQVCSAIGEDREAVHRASEAAVALLPPA